MASNNHLVLEIVLENSRAAVEEKQKQEIRKVQTRYFELKIQAVLPKNFRVGSELRQKIIIDFVLPAYSQALTFAVRRGEFEPSLVQSREVQLAYYRERIQKLQQRQELPTAPFVFRQAET